MGRSHPATQVAEWQKRRLADVFGNIFSTPPLSMLNIKTESKQPERQDYLYVLSRRGILARF